MTRPGSERREAPGAAAGREADLEVTVLLFAQVRLAAGTSRIELSLPSGSSPTVQSALDRLEETHPGIHPHLASCRFAVGHDYVPSDHPLRAGDELSLIPPVQGG